jgi:hypothetical protein
MVGGTHKGAFIGRGDIFLILIERENVHPLKAIGNL